MKLVNLFLFANVKFCSFADAFLETIIMKKICLLFFAIALCFSSYGQYVDLGLPSGTLWKSANEKGFYGFEEAVVKFGNNLPEKWQWTELLNSCSWTWTGAGFNIVGPNGKSIFLPPLGKRECEGFMDDEDSGYYWSATVSSNAPNYSWVFLFDEGGGDWDDYDWCDRCSIRLVQNR